MRKILFLLVVTGSLVCSAETLLSIRVKSVNQANTPKERLTRIDQTFGYLFRHLHNATSDKEVADLIDLRNEACGKDRSGCLNTDKWGDSSCATKNFEVQLWSSVLTKIENQSEATGIWPAVTKCSKQLTKIQVHVILNFLEIAHQKSWSTLEITILDYVSQRLKGASPAERQAVFAQLDQQLGDRMNDALVPVDLLRLLVKATVAWTDTLPSGQLPLMEFTELLQHSPATFSLIGANQDYVRLFDKLTAAQKKSLGDTYWNLVIGNCWIFRQLGLTSQCMNNLDALKTAPPRNLTDSLRFEEVESDIEVGAIDDAEKILKEADARAGSQNSTWLQLAHAQIALARGNLAQAETSVDNFSKLFLSNPFSKSKFPHVPALQKVMILMQKKDYAHALQVADAARAQMLKIYSQSSIEPVVSLDFQRLMLAALMQNSTLVSSVSAELKGSFKIANFIPNQEALSTAIQDTFAGHQPNIEALQKQTGKSSILSRQVEMVLKELALKRKKK